jgi:hypothetical protein
VLVPVRRFGINNAGQITGMGLYDGQQTAFLMTDPGAIGAVPEPSVVLLMAAGMGLIVLLKRLAMLKTTPCLEDQT